MPAAEPALLNVGAWMSRSAVNGPGLRFVLWLQGCTLRCPGCWNEEFWSLSTHREMTVDECVALVRATPDIEGVTFTGGEPLLQAGPLSEVARRVRKSGRTVMVFTGFEIEELVDDAARRLLDHCDVLVCGRYREKERDLSLAWRSSRNQRVVFLTDAYSSDAQEPPARVEVRLDACGRMLVTGFPPDELLQGLV